MMDLLLLIDCAGEQASVHLGVGANCVGSSYNNSQKDHAAWVHQAIENLLQQCGKTMKELSAVAVTEGPGSYTGLRVGMSTAKGIAYALQLPLIVVSSLKLMAANAIRESGAKNGQLFIPMIDARRMEVFTAAYDGSLNEVMAPKAVVLSSDSFKQLDASQSLVFTGSGAAKWMNVCSLENAGEVQQEMSGQTFLELVHEKLKQRDFADLAYAEPFYLKEFYTGKE
jgi:tRNA threonylcarbamoyladenosine biosynthesis protein TsaB